MANARLQQLLEQRRASRGQSFGDRRRILAPTNNAISSISKRTVTSELDVMVKKYNEGQIGNEEMRSFLQKTVSNSALAPNDRQDVETQLRDFDDRIQKDALEAAYKAAPESTLVQVNAARALADYYKNRAAKMAPGTPVQSQNLQSAAEWDQKVVDVQNSAQKKARQNLRYSQEKEVNALPSNSSERASAKAEMYKKLYDQAVADGDATDANKYAAYYQQEVTSANELAVREDERSTKESINAEKTDLRNTLGALQNAYHDGQIDENTYLQALSEISPRIDATNDYGLINTLNRTTDIIQKNLNKGGLQRGTSSVGGLPTVLGKGKGGKGSGGGSGVLTDWDQQDFDYSDSLRKLQDGLRKGKLSTQDYKENLMKVVEQRVKDIEAQTAAVEAIAQENPNAKVLYNGKKTRAADVLESLSTEYSKLETQAGAILYGNPKNLALVMVGPKEFSKAGDVTKSGKSFSTYELVDTANMPKDEYTRDLEGVYHPVLQRERPLTLEEQANVYNNTYTDTNGKTYKVRTDASTGNQYLITGEKYAKVYKPFSSEFREVESNKEGVVPNYEAASRLLKQAEQTARVKPGFDKFKAQIANQDAVTRMKVEQQNQPIEKAKQFVDKAVAPVFQQATKAVGDVVKPIVAKVDEALMPNVVAPVPIKKAEDVGITPQTRVQLPELRVPQQAQTAYQPIKLPELKVMGAVKPNPIQQMAKQNNIKPVAIPSPKGLPTIKKADPNAFKNEILKPVANFVKGIGTKIFGKR